MRATVVVARNPLAPLNGRTLAEVRRPLSLSRLARLHGVDPRAQPTLCCVNGAWVLQRHWRHRRIRDGDVAAFVALPQGGGGKGGSNPMAIVLMIAVAVVAPYIGGAIAGAIGVESAIGVSLIKGLVGLAGTLLVNALLPPPKPPGSSQIQALAAGSPTYTLQAQGNQARLGGTIPVLYGRHLVYPDYGAQPYSEFAGNESFLYQLFVVGQGAYQIDEIRIEDTPISSFAEVTTEVVEPGGTVTLFPANVVTSNEVAGQEATHGAYLGPFVVNAAGTQLNALAVDVVASKGLYYANDDGSLNQMTIGWSVEAQLIDDNGAALGAWFALDARVMAGATNTPVRESYRYPIAPGRYQVRLTRTSAKDTSARAGHDLNWAGLRGYLPGSQSYGQVTMLAIRMRASNQLSAQSARRINLIVTRKLPTRAAGAWTAAQATRSIAWALADVLRSVTYGAGRADSEIDIAGLEALDTTWAARGDYFDGVFDSPTGTWEALQTIARAGRAAPILQSGRIYVVRDQAASLPTAVYSMRNIVRGSFQLRYLMVSDESPNGVEVEYFDADVWAPRTVQAGVGGDPITKPARAKLFGVTTRAHAWREGKQMAAANRYRRKLVTFQTELEGHISTYGDLIAVQHDLPAWGQFAEVVAYDAGTRTATLDEPLDWTGAGTFYAALRKPNGAMSGPYTATQGATTREVVFGTALDFTPNVGQDRERTQLVFGLGTAYSQLCRVIAVRPRGKTVEIAAVNEDALVHSADGGTAPTPETWGLPGIPTKPIIPGGLFVVGGGTPANPTASISWSAAAGADYYVIEHSRDGSAWTRVGEVTRTNFTMDVPAGTNWFRVAPFGKVVGDWVSWNGAITGEQVGPAAAPVPVNLVAQAGLATIILTWDAINNPQVARTEILRNTTSNSAGAQVITTVTPSVTVWQDDIGSVGVTRYYWVRTVTRAGAVSGVSNVATATTGTIDISQTTGLVTSTQIADDSITTPKLAANAVVASKIAAGQITADKMVAGTITAASGILAAASITSANIQDAAIVSAKIADAQVTTLKIGAQQVTIPVGATVSGGFNVPAFTQYAACSAAIVTSGAPVFVWCSFKPVLFVSGVYAQHYIYLARDGAALTPVLTQSMFNTNSVDWNPQLAALQDLYTTFAVVDQPAAGAHTYSLIFYHNDFAPWGQTTPVTILLLEVKR